MKKFFPLLFLALPCMIQAQGTAANPTVVSLDDAIRLAHQNSTQMRNTDNTVRQREMALTQRYAAFLPSVSTSASLRPAQNGNNANFGAGLSIGLNSIFDYNSYFAVGQARRQLEVAQANRVQTTYSLTAIVKQQYYAALQSQEQLTIAQNQLAVTDSQLKQTRLRVQEGMVVASDSLSAIISHLNAQNSVSSAVNNLDNAYQTLSRTLNIDYIVRPEISDTAGFQFVQLDSAELFAYLENSPAIMTERAGIADAKYSLRTAKLQYLPRPSGSLSFSRNGQGQGFFGFDNQQYRYSGGDFSLSFSISLQIFNGFGREVSLTNAKRSVEFAEEDYDILVRTQQQDLARRIRDLRLLEQQMKVQELSVLASEEAVRVARIRYTSDYITDLEMINAQNTLFNTRNTLVNQRYSYRNQIAQLEQLLGRDIIR